MKVSIESYLHEGEVKYKINAGEKSIKNINFGAKINDEVVLCRTITKTREKTFADEVGPGKCWSIDFEDRKRNLVFVLKIYKYDQHEFLGLQIGITNHSQTNYRVNELYPLILERDSLQILKNNTKKLALMKNGIRKNDIVYNYFFDKEPQKLRHNVSNITDFTEVDNNFYSITENIKCIKSEYMTVIKAIEDKEAILLGFYSTGNYFSNISVMFSRVNQRINQVRTECVCDDVGLYPGQTIESEKLMIIESIEIQDLLDLYTRITGKNMQAIQEKKVPTGWCSWYYYYNNVTAQHIIDNLRFLRENNYPIDVVLIDDGWERKIGDWYANDKFPEGMKYYADLIKASGYVPGIWIAPFQVSKDSELYKANPEWVLRDEQGKEIEFKAGSFITGYGLDCTNPAVLEWIENTLQRLAKEWGYKYIKLDFLRTACLPGERYDKNSTRAQALKRGMKKVIDSVDKDIFLLGCGGQYGPIIGTVHAMRTSCDTGCIWNSVSCSVKNALRRNVHNWYMNKRFWINDPDCLIVRDNNSFHFNIAERVRSSEIYDEEVRTQIGIMGLLGGMVFLGDEMYSLSPAREEYLKYLLPLYNGRGIYVDSLEKEIPSVLKLEAAVNGLKSIIINITNWHDYTEDFSLDLANIGLDNQSIYHVYDFWSREYKGIKRAKDKLTRTIKPHDSILLSFIKVKDFPTIIFSSFHITQGAKEIKKQGFKDNVLTFCLNNEGLKKNGEIHIFIPEQYKPVGVEGYYSLDGNILRLFYKEIDFLVQKIKFKKK